MEYEFHGDRWLTPKEVARKLKFNVKTIQRWCREGTIPASRVGRRRFVIDWEQMRKQIQPTPTEELAHESLPLLHPDNA